MVLKWNCCVPLCTNNWRNSPNVKVHSIPSDESVRKEYARLIRNDNLRDSSSTKICGEHFVSGERIARHQLPTIFPWTKETPARREIKKHPLVASTSKKRKAASDIHISEVESDCKATRINEQESEADTGMSHGKTETPVPQIYIGAEDAEHEVVDNAEVQTSENDLLRQEIGKLKAELNVMKHQEQHQPSFNIDDYKNSDKDISFYTGFPNYETMLLCYKILEPKLPNISYGYYTRTQFDLLDHERPGRRRKLSPWQEYTMVLMRMRLGLFAKDLAHRFRVSESTVSHIFRAWVKFMRAELEPICILWPSKEQIKHFMTPLLKEFYPELVSIIDCTEIFMESPSGLDNQSACYSHYKSHNTMKGLVGITPNGVISFVSDLYSGSISDPEIVNKSGYLTHLAKGDLVMADKGFTIQDDLASVGARLVIPYFLKSRGQFPKAENEHNKKIASLRIHVERCMERLKNWHFFDRPVPITVHDLAPDIWIVIACLSNFLPPLIN